MSGHPKAFDGLAKKAWTIKHLDNVEQGVGPTLLRQAQELSGLAFRQFDLATGQMLVCGNFQSVLGYTPVQTIEEVAARVHPDDRETFLSWCLKQFTSVGRSALSFRIRLPSGPDRWIETQAETLPDKHGKPARVLLTSRDVTRHRISEFDRIATADRLHRVQSAALVGTWETDLTTGSELWSSEAWALIEPGGTGEANVERFMAAVYPDDRDMVWRRVEEAMETGHYLDEFRVVHPDGTVHWLKGIGTVEPNDAGQRTQVRGVVIDITSRKQAEERLERFATIIEAMPDFVSGCDLEGRIIYANPAARKMIGIGPEEPVAGLQVVDFMRQEDRDLLPGIIQTVARDGKWRGEMEMLSLDGSTIPTSIICVLHRDAGGKPLYVSAIARDMTREQAATQALQIADRRKNEFLATLAHELRNPLMPLQSAADVLRQMETADARLGTVRSIVENQTAHLKRLINDLLDVSRLTTGKLSLQTAPAGIAEVVRAAVEMCQVELATRGHDLELAIPEAAAGLCVDGDVFRLTQVLVNLIGNAAKYTPNGGRVRVEVRQEGAAVCIAVEDDGIGIAADFLPKIFDAFAQADDKAQGAEGGLGLGLMLVKQIVELHGGTVTAASQGLGKGACFTLRLPLLIGVASPPTEADQHAEPISLKGVGVRVLVVDDYAAIRDALELMLTMHGFVVATAPNGDEALARIAGFKPDAVLMDMRMPRMNGIELARRIRQLPDGSAYRLVGMTGNATAEDRRIALASGLDDHVMKPVPADRLIELLVRTRPAARAVA